MSLAVELTHRGYYVFPLMENGRPRDEATALHSATNDPYHVEDLFSHAWVKNVGVNTGKSGVIVLDIDRKNGKDGFEQISDNWLTVDETFHYTTKTGNGEHHVYRAPDTGYYKPTTDYRGMPGVDRRSGGSYVVWRGAPGPMVTDLPEAPEWLLDQTEENTPHRFDGTLEDWMATLTEGEPGGLVVNAMNKLVGVVDLSHSDMVALQFNAIRLGAEGFPGVPDLLDRIKEIWMNRDPAAHSTPEREWLHKWDEAFESGIKKYGDQVEELSRLPEYKFDKVPRHVADILTSKSELSESEWLKALRLLVRDLPSDDDVATILWNAPSARGVSTDFGIEYVSKRIQAARAVNEPVRENPYLKIDDPSEDGDTKSRDLLTEQEREYLTHFPTFADDYLGVADSLGWVNTTLARGSAWIVLSMATAFNGFIPKSATTRMGLNLWMMMPADSGTGKSKSISLRNELLRTLFDGDNTEGAGWQLGVDSSVPGMHEALLQRDGLPVLLDADEATRFFKQIQANDWQAGVDNTLAHWYEGRVDPSNKIRLKELKGVSAVTSFTIHMAATPDDLYSTLTRDMFKTGFLARFVWVVGPESEITDQMFEFQQDLDVQTWSGINENVGNLAKHLYELRYIRDNGEPVPVALTDEARARLSQAYKKMYMSSMSEENWDIIEPSIRRLSETLHKVTVMNALYQGRETAVLADALAAIQTVEEWFQNLFNVADRISSGAFIRDCDEIVAYIGEKSQVTEATLYHRFRGMVTRSRKDIDDRVDFLLHSGRIVKKMDSGVTRYLLNGGLRG